MRERESAQLSFADAAVAELGGRRTQTTLDQLDTAIDWRALSKPIRKLYHNDDGGAPAEPVMMMLKIVLLQKWFNLSDPQAEEQLNDRLSFRRFVGLRGDTPAPDETTIVKFRKRLREGDVERKLFDIVARSIADRGLLVKEGTLVDALIIEAPTGRKTGKKDEAGNDQTTRDTDASFTKKHGQTYHGYKGHLAADRSGIVTDFAFSTASHHDSRYIDQLTEQETKAVLADAAYADQDRRDIEPTRRARRHRAQADARAKETAPALAQDQPRNRVNPQHRRTHNRAAAQMGRESGSLSWRQTQPLRLHNGVGGAQPSPSGVAGAMNHRGEGARRKPF